MATPVRLAAEWVVVERFLSGLCAGEVALTAETREAKYVVQRGSAKGPSKIHAPPLDMGLLMCDCSAFLC